MKSLAVKDFDLAKTLKSGQMFRFYPEKKGYVVLARQSLFYVEQSCNLLLYDNCDRHLLYDYFSLDFNASSYHDYLRSIGLEKIIPSAEGIRLVRQDTWETILTFLLSQNANMKKIRRNLDMLSRRFGRKIRYCDQDYFFTPQLGSLDNKQGIVESSVGYRSPFVFAANHMITSFWIERLRGLPYPQAKAALMDIPGVGPKVADCVCLYGLHLQDAFPIDIWVKRALEDVYFKGKEQSIAKLEQFAHKTFPEHKGYVQQYLFEWRRLESHMNKKKR